MRRFALALLVSVSVLAACGDDDSSADARQPYADALSDTFAADNLSDEFSFTDENAECVASRSAEVIGLERLEKVGDPEEVTDATAEDLSVFELPQDELDQISAAFLDCIDDAEQLLRDEFLEGSPVEGEQAACVAGLVDRDLLIRILSTGIGGQDPATQLSDVQAEFENCS